jgi:hypothetical protein
MRKIWPAIAALALVAAACGDSGDSGGGEPAATQQPAATTATTPAATTPDATTPDATGDGLELEAASGWTATAIGEGAKPVLALDGAGSPAIAWVQEDLSGFVAFASAADAWTVDELIVGYFYGPIGLAFDPEDRPHVVYHDHQDNTFKQDLGDLTHAVREGSDWDIAAINDAGHDGWDSTVAIGADGIVRAAGIDPQQFDSDVGVEYYELSDGDWDVTEIGSGPIEYEWNASLAVDPAGDPAISYFDNNTQDLMYASRAGGTWTIETITADGDVGRFSSLAFDGDGRPHVSFLALPSTVSYAVRDGGAWTIEEVGTLDQVVIAFEGARRITDIGIGAGGMPHIAFADQAVVRYATKDSGAWALQDVAAAGSLPLGQQVSLRIDAAGIPHIATYEVTGGGPLTGVIAYLTPA